MRLPLILYIASNFSPKHSATTRQEVMDAPWKSMWPLQLLARRRIQEMLQNNTRPDMPTPVQSANLLDLPPLLSRLVVSDAVELETTNWDHLAMLSVPPIHESCKV